MTAAPAIEVRHLTKDFRIGLKGVKLRAVDDLSLSIPRGQVYGLLGPNGCGKSTTLKVVLGLVTATAGIRACAASAAAASTSDPNGAVGCVLHSAAVTRLFEQTKAFTPPSEQRAACRPSRCAGSR